jgi:hypothetical protein
MPKQKKIRRILLVDDESVVAQSTSRMLNFLGYEVNLAASAQEALDIFEKDRFDLVIADYAMPGMNGDALADSIKRLAPEQPVWTWSSVSHLSWGNSGELWPNCARTGTNHKWLKRQVERINRRRPGRLRGNPAQRPISAIAISINLTDVSGMSHVEPDFVHLQDTMHPAVDESGDRPGAKLSD